MTARSPEWSGGDPTLARVRVLVVDDDEQWARVTARLLEANDDAFTVETATSLESGRERFGEGDYDCVVCDYRLGDGTGLDLLGTVREADESLPFLLVTGRGDESVASDAIGAGVTDYVRKGAADDRADLLAGRVANAVRTYRTERALERERRSKNDMLDVLTATTAESELSQQFCTRLVETRGYACAWIGTEDGSGAPVPRAAAGREAYVDDVVTGDRDHPADEPAREALDRGEPVVRRDLGGTADADPADGEDGPARGGWAATAVTYGFESAVAVPVRHDGVRFGVLAAYAADSGTVDDRELAALVDYAETVGYALRTTERKRSLMSASPVTLQVTVADDSVPMVALANALPAGATLETLSAVTRGDETTLYVVEVTGTTPSAFERAAAGVGRIESFEHDGGSGQVADEVSDDEAAPPLRCEVVAAPPTPEAVVADHGAGFERTVVADGVATLSVSVPDDGTVTALAEALADRYEDATVSTVWTGGAEATAGSEDPLAVLTDRQREVLRHAVEVGYFDRPRGATATELAEHFDVSRTTLSRHLRTAQRKVFGTLLT